MTTDLESPHSTGNTPGRSRRGGRRWVTAAGAAAVFVAGLATGVAVPEDSTELDAANSQLHASRDEIDGLALELATAEERNDALTASLNAADARAATAGEEAAAAQERLESREAKLDKRAKALQRREEAVAAREDAFDVTVSAPQNGGSSGGDFDRAYALDITTDIIEDIGSVDERLRDGGLVSSALSLLSDSYGRLIDAGFPPGVDESEYYGRVTTLQSFAEQAADAYYDNPTGSSARYAVIRKETGVLFDTINAALGTQLRLP